MVMIVFSLLIFLYFVPLGLWFQAGVSIGFGNIGMLKLIIMRFRKISQYGHIFYDTKILGHGRGFFTERIV